jgi:hypothetical protein
MKTRKHFIAMALFAVIAILVLSMTGCGEDEPDPTDNLSVPYGTLPNGVGIYKGDASISDAQMATAVQYAIAGYNSVRPEFGSPNGKFTKLVITSGGSAYSWDAVNKILSVDVNAPTSAYFRDRFEAIANGTIT